MRSLKTAYFNLAESQRMLIMAGVLLLMTAALYLAVINPLVQSYGLAKVNLARTNEAIVLLDGQLKELQSMGETNQKLGADQIELLRGSGNEIVFSSQVSDFLEVLKDLNAKVGGAGFELTEGEVGPAYIEVGPRRDVFEVKRLPVTITFETDYAGVSNYLFELSALKRLVRMENVEISSGRYETTGTLKVSLEMGVFFIEES